MGTTTATPNNPTAATAIEGPTITVRSVIYDRLVALAQRAGKPVEVLADEMLTRTLSKEEELAPHAGPQPEMTFGDLVAPLHEDFARSGLSEGDLDALIEQARDEVFREQQQRAAAGK